MTFALNHLAPFLLTNLLLPVLRRSPEPRVVTVSSRAHVGAEMSFDDLEGRVRRLQDSGVTANALHPGFVASEFGKNNRGFLRVATSIAQRLGAVSVEEGARTSVYLACSGELKGVTGRYDVNCRPQVSSPASRNTERMRRLWEISARMTGLAVDDSTDD